MTEDEVVREVRAAREAFAAAHGYDIPAMVAALRELDTADDREVVRLAPRPVTQTSVPTKSATEDNLDRLRRVLFSGKQRFASSLD